jgi:hypothetical protein
VNPIDVVALHDVRDDAHHVVVYGRLPRIEPEHVSVHAHEIATRAEQVRRRETRAVGRVARAERVDPRMELEAARVRLLYRERERVVPGIGALRPREQRRPRLDRRPVDGVGRRPHLQDHGIEAGARRTIENAEELGALLIGAERRPRWPVDVRDGRHPEPAHLALDGREDSCPALRSSADRSRHPCLSTQRAPGALRSSRRDAISTFTKENNPAGSSTGCHSERRPKAGGEESHRRPTRACPLREDRDSSPPRLRAPLGMTAPGNPPAAEWCERASEQIRGLGSEPFRESVRHIQLENPATLAFRRLALHFYIVENFLSPLDVPAPITPTLPSPPPRIPAMLLRALLPFAERDEVLADLADEYRYRVETFGSATARVWYWRQTLASAPSLVRRSWWRGWSGFEPTANRMHPGGPSMESWIMDVRYAARRLVRRPLYALLSIITLALGIGGTAAVYGIARPILLDRLPYAAEEGLVTFWSPFDWNEQEFLYLREGKFTGFSSVAAYRPDDVTLDRGDGGPARLLPGIATSAELFSVLGAAPALGRTFQKGDDIQGAEPVAVLSYGVWRELGGDKSIIGSRVRLDGVARTIVGVMPRGFWFPDPSVRVWIAHPFNPENRAGNYAFVGRIAPGQRFESMAGPVATFVRTLDDRFDYNPQWDKTKNTVLTPLRTFLVGSLRPALIATLTAMG